MAKLNGSEVVAQRCPSCGIASASRRSVALNRGQMEVTVQCSRCLLEWQVTDADGGPALLILDLIDDPRR